MSKIEWTQDTWNPIVGCSIVSPGCTNCYAMRMAARLEAMGDAAVKAGRAVPMPHYVGTTKWVNGNPVWTGKLALAPDHVLTKPLRRRKRTTWFVNSMGDLFHEDVLDEWISQVFYVMAQCPQHTFQVLTKRSANMRRVMSDAGFVDDVKATLRIIDNPNEPLFQWPLPNVWLGVSAERQQEADERIPDLLATPAAVRFVSAEPLLGPVDFTNWLYDFEVERDGDLMPGLDWIIVGGESGPDARPMHPDWARSIRDQCEAAGVAFFFKQWGEWLWSNDDQNYAAAEEWRRRHFPTAHAECHSSGHTSLRVGKSRAGRLLDGRTHDAMPAQRAESKPERVETAPLDLFGEKP